MKYLGIICGGIVALGLAAATAAADETPASVAPSTLASMGFAGVALMSDEEGLAVRGMGAFGTNVWKGKIDHRGGKHDVGKRGDRGGHGKHLVCAKNAKSFNHGGKSRHGGMTFHSGKSNHGGNGIHKMAKVQIGMSVR